MDEHGFEARLRHLEHILVGQQNTQLSKAAKETILKRVEVLQKELNTVYKNNKPIKEFVEKCKVSITISRSSQSYSYANYRHTVH
jgi:DNA-directed RNA polymerase subunit H (RpoH/RPB5)